MFSPLSRLGARRYLQAMVRHPLIQSYCTSAEIRSHVKPNRSSLFSNRDRYKMFEKNTGIVYEFDDETRNIIDWPSPKQSPANCSWTQSTNTDSNDDLVFAFADLLNFSAANNIPLSDPRFNGFVDQFTQRLQDFSLNQTVRALQYFVRHPMDLDSIRQPNYIELLQAFDQVCTIKSRDLLPEQLLFVSSIWKAIPFARKTYMTQSLCRLFNRFMNTFDAPQMTQALFFVNSMGQGIENIRALENVLEKNMDDLTMEEFSGVLYTFCRQDTQIQKQELKHKFFAYLEKHDLNQLSDRKLAPVLMVKWL